MGIYVLDGPDGVDGAGGGGGGGGGGRLPLNTYGVIDPRWPRRGLIRLVGEAYQAEGMSGLSLFGTSQVIYPSAANPLTGDSALTATPRIYLEQAAFPACGIGNEIANGHVLRARDGYHLVLRIGGLATGVGADDFAGFGALAAIDIADLANLDGIAMLGVSDVRLTTPADRLDLIVTADDGTLTSLRLPSRPDGKMIFEVYARPNPTGACSFMQLRVYDDEARAPLGDELIITDPALIPQEFVSPFLIANRGGTLESSFHCASIEFGAGGSPAEAGG